MATQVIVSAIGKDRPGIVHKLSNAVWENGGNITVQRSVKLGGEFAIIVMFSADLAGGADTLLAKLNALGDEQLQVSARLTETGVQADENLRELKVSGADQPGIINTLALFLLEHGLNIQAMDYTTASAPFTAAPIFNASILVSLSEGSDFEKVRENLRVVELDLNIDVEIEKSAPHS
ncbi:MAG: ACT domain-containing protein [Candidatus Hydrogenedentes bacterium]|jgi:glycine cleavage system transcriptional repressor|nr:ACT domain-containing protein [Candidatus Hydrogenedentota bacterium]